MEGMTAPLSSQPSAVTDQPMRRLIRAPSWRVVVHDLLNRPSSSRAARGVQIGTMAVIVLSACFFVLQSEPSLASWGGWGVLDTLIALLFTLEYALRILTAPDGRGDEEDEVEWDFSLGALRRRPPAATRCEARKRCTLQPLVLVDLAAILPFWLSATFAFLPDAVLSPVRSLRLVRILRMLRLAQARVRGVSAGGGRGNAGEAVRGEGERAKQCGARECGARQCGARQC